MRTSSDTRTHKEKSYTGWEVCETTYYVNNGPDFDPALGDRHRQIPGPHWSASFSKMVFLSQK